MPRSNMAHEIPQNFALRTEEHALAGRGNPVAEETGDQSKTRQNDVARRTGKTTRRGHGFVNEIGAAGMLRGQRTEGLFCAAD
jgi:hypothetical protein